MRNLEVFLMNSLIGQFLSNQGLIQIQIQEVDQIVA